MNLFERVFATYRIKSEAYYKNWMREMNQRMRAEEKLRVHLRDHRCYSREMMEKLPGDVMHVPIIRKITIKGDNKNYEQSTNKGGQSE